MKYDFDVAVIGGGLLGCFAARNLMRYDLSSAVFERREDVCTGISRANTAIVYTGYDTKPGTLKTRVCVEENRRFPDLCRTLGVRFSKCGSLLVCFGERGLIKLQKKFRQGMENGVGGIRMLTPGEVLDLEPNLSDKVFAGLFAENTGTVLPWELGCAAAENAAKNGAKFYFNTAVTDIGRADGGYVIRTSGGDFAARGIINCAGLFADEVQEMLFEPAVRLSPTRGDYYVLDTKAEGFIKHVIFHEPEEKGKGLTLVPTVGGNILAGPSEIPTDVKDDFSTTGGGLSFLDEMIETVVPGLPREHIIRSFSSLRPNPFYVVYDENLGGFAPNGDRISNFTITEPDDKPSFLSLIGIKTPGLTCSDGLGRYVSDKIAHYLGVPENVKFDPCRASPIRTADMDIDSRNALIAEKPAYGRIVCRCRQVSEGEIIDAIHRFPGAVTVDGVKRRTDAGTGRCQGGFCTQRVMEILACELNCRPENILKDGPGSYILEGGGCRV